MCSVVSCWIYEYTKILLGAHPIFHISRIRVNFSAASLSTKCHQNILSGLANKILGWTCKGMEISGMICFYSKTNEMHQILKIILFCSCTPHVSDGLSVHLQKSETVHTASGVCKTDSADCLLAGTRWNCRSISFPLPSI
jgi:uncharacterized membrane protein